MLVRLAVSKDLAVFLILGLAGDICSAAPTAGGGPAERPFTKEEYLQRAKGTYEDATKKLLNELRSKGGSSYVLIDKADSALARAQSALRTLHTTANDNFRASSRNVACLEAFKEISVAYVPIDIWHDAGLIEPSPILYPQGREALERMRHGKRNDLIAWGSVCLPAK